MIVFLSLICALLIVLLIVSAWFNVRLAKTIFKVEEQIEESLDVLDECYGTLSSAAATPVFSDEPIIRDVVNSIKHARDAVLVVANKLTIIDVVDDDDDE